MRTRLAHLVREEAEQAHGVASIAVPHHFDVPVADRFRNGIEHRLGTDRQAARPQIAHFHGDHVGNANLFTGATLYIQQAEYDAAFGSEPAKFNFNPALYEKLRATPIVRLQGDHDVFGDGSVVIYSTPGHTPGHQSLLVRMPKTGPVLLSGDAVHFRENWENRRVPARNFSKEQSLASMEKLAAILDREHATLWINHDKPQTDTLPHAPDFVE